MLCLSSKFLGFNFSLTSPSFFNKSSYKFRCYEVTYLRPNGCYKTEFRFNLPRVSEFRDFENHFFKDYIGKTTGLNWEIKTIRIVECKYL